MILIKHNIRHDQFIIHNLTGLEASAVYLYPQHTSKLLFVAAYQPPSAPLSALDLDQIFAQNDSVLIVGDLNSKHVSWNNTPVNRNGRSLVTYCIDNQVTISYPDQPTYFPHHSTPSVLDIALTKRCPLSKSKSVAALFSDHDPVAFKILLHPTTYTPRSRYNYHQADWQLFRKNLDLALDIHQPVHTIPDLDRAISIFETSVREAASAAIPVHSGHGTHLLLPHNVRAMQKLKNYYQRKFQRSRLLAHHQLYSLYSQLFSTIFSRLRNAKWTSFLQTLHPQSPQLWKITRYLKKNPPTIPPLTHHGTQVSYTPLKSRNFGPPVRTVQPPHYTYGIAPPRADGITHCQQVLPHKHSSYPAPTTY